MICEGITKEGEKKLFLIYLGRSGGAPKFILDFSEAITKDNKIEKLEILISKHNLLKQEFINLKSDIQLFDTPTSNRNSFTKIFKFSFNFIKSLEIAKKNKIKKFLFPMTHIWNPVAMILIKIIVKKPEIYFISHDANIHPGEKNAKLQYKIMQTEIALSDKIITLTENVKNILANRWKNKKIIVLNHPTYNFGETKIAKELPSVPTFIFFGRIVKYKGLDLFVKAIEIFKKQNQNFKVIIAGEGEIENETLKIIKNNSDKIELINRYINEDEIVKIYNRGDICVLPYIEASQSGIVAIAINKAMPCIITPVDGLIEQCEAKNKSNTFAIMSDKIDPGSIAEKMSQILNKNLYKKLSENSINFQEKLSWNKWIKEFLEN